MLDAITATESGIGFNRYMVECECVSLSISPA